MITDYFVTMYLGMGNDKMRIKGHVETLGGPWGARFWHEGEGTKSKNRTIARMVSMEYRGTCMCVGGFESM